jgi:hypothetical protein
MSSRPPPPPMSTRPVFPPNKVDVVMRPDQLYQRPSSSHSVIRPSSQASLPLPAPAPSTVAYLADNLARQTLSHRPSEVVPGPQQSLSGISSPVMQMPSAEASLRRPSTSPTTPSVSPRPPASSAPVASWSQYPGQQQLHYTPYNHPPAPPLGSHPSSSPQGKPSAIGGPGYDRHDPNMHSHAASFPRVEQFYPSTIPNSGVPQETYMAMDKPPHPNPTYPAPSPLSQDYFQHQMSPAQPPSSSHSPRPYPPPEWQTPNPPPPLAHHNRAYILYTAAIALLILVVVTRSSHTPTVSELLRPEPVGTDVDRQWWRGWVQSRGARTRQGGGHRGEGREETAREPCAERVEATEQVQMMLAS